MNTKLLLASSLRTMRRFKLRTFFMGVGVAVGVAVLVAARSLGTGSEQAMLDKVENMFGPGSILISARDPRAQAPIETLKIADIEAIDDAIEEIVAWDPMLVVGRRQLRAGDVDRQVTVHGHSERAQEVWNRGVVEGRFFTADDLASAARVALLGTTIARDLFGDASPVGEQIQIDGAPFRVVGVLEPAGIDPHGTDRDQDVFAPTTTVMRRVFNVDYINLAKVLVADPETVEATAERIGEILRQRHGIADGERPDFATFTPAFVGRMIGRSQRVLKVFVPLGAGVVLLVAGIVIASIMLIAVRERVPEVGLRKAVGATAAQISWQFLAEAVAVTLASGIAGLLLGAGAVAVVAAKMGLPVVITPGSLVLGVAAALAVGVIAGLLPARRAARLDPIAALS